MKGLIRNTMYSMESNIKLAFLISGVLIFVPLATSEAAVSSMIISIQIFVFLANVGTSLHADEVSKWNKFECTLPVKKSAVILAKYISFCMLILFGLAISALTGILALFKNPQTSVNSLVWGYEYGLTLSLVTAAAMYPVMLKIGTEKNELILILSALAAVLFMGCTAALLIPFTGEMNLRSPFVGAVTVCTAPFILLLSYFVSLRIYKNKEF